MDFFLGTVDVDDDAADVVSGPVVDSDDIVELAAVLAAPVLLVRSN